MGLPLFIPPVESDVPSKPSTKGPVNPSHARSPIRRTERRRQLNETRERRLRMLTALQASEYATETERQSLLSVLARTANASARSLTRADTPRVSGRQSPRLENPRISELTDLERHQLGRAAIGEQPRGFAIDDLDDAFSRLSDMVPSHFPTIQSSSTQRSNALQLASRHASVSDTRHLARRRGIDRDNGESRYGSGSNTRHTARRRGVDRDNSEFRTRRSRYAPERADLMIQPASMGVIATHRHAQRVRYVDGLGDRDRSLSPEGDGVWDTLQSTLTPDPQPPSIGSSFASTVSATTSETNGTNSATTSMTTPNEEIEPPCDPVTDNPGSDGEDDGEERPSRQSTPRGWRSYADVAAEAQTRQSTESADASDHDREWLSGMHRIVRGLASRDDIPDEWWAQAGLSRSMSWEDSI